MSSIPNPLPKRTGTGNEELELALVITSWTMIGYGAALVVSVFLNILTFSWGESELHYGSTGQ